MSRRAQVTLTLVLACCCALADGTFVQKGVDPLEPLDRDQPLYRASLDPEAPTAVDAARPVEEGETESADAESTETEDRTPLRELYDGRASMMELMRTTGQKIQCWMPPPDYRGGQRIQGSVPFEEVERRLDRFKGSCFSYDEGGWWSYQFCYKVEVFQEHVPPPKSRDEHMYFSMGKYQGSTYPHPDSPDEEAKEYVQYYSGGQMCEETNAPRTTKVVFKCDEDRVRASAGFRLQEYVMNIDEVSVCSYKVQFYSAELCESEEYQKRNKKNIHEIQCEMAPGEGPFIDVTVPGFKSNWNWF